MKEREKMSLVKGIHHVSLKCSSAQEYDEEKKFYTEVLQIQVVREWSNGIMFDTGSGIIEIFNDAEDTLPQGTIRHFAFATDDVDACIKAVSEAGYEVFVEPMDVVIDSEPEFPVRVAFCRGPLGEEIEFFMEG
jgi:glyoxylase I family protein